MGDKLQGIKTDWQQEKDTNQFRQLSLEVEDIEWLIEQTEKAERYENALKDVISNYGRVSPLGLLEIVQKALKS